MMRSMSGLDVTGAIAYNKSKAGKLWKQEDLPWPLSFKILRDFFIPVDSPAFVTGVAMFQGMHGLLPDGKLGPATYAIMRSVKPAVQENEVAHDFEETENDRDVAFPADADTFAPARTDVSNCLIIDGKSVKLSAELLKLGITASNYIDDDERHFEQFRPRKKVTHFVIHESVTMSAAQTIRVLDGKRRSSARAGKNDGKGWDYGIHLNLCPDGHIICNADLVRERLVQANQLNDESFGMEVVNPYNPKFAKPPFTETIPGPWWCWKPKNGKKIYTLPTPAQMRAIWPLCRFLAGAISTLPLAFPTADLGAKKTRIEGWGKGAQPSPGIVAHRDFASHADGRYLLEHCIEQMNKPMHEQS